jgi:protein phosphatase
MVDAGRLTPEEAASHPQRSLLVKALGTGSAAGQAPDLTLHEPRPGDRYLLCSDGLTAVVPTAEIREMLAARTAPEVVVRCLVDAANAAGGPDNIACAVADIILAA